MDEEFLVKEIQEIEALAEEIVKGAQEKAKELEARAKEEIDRIALEYERTYVHQVKEAKCHFETHKLEEGEQLKARYEAAQERLQILDETALNRMVERIVKRVCEE